MKDHIRPLGHEFFSFARFGKIGGAGLDRKRRAGRGRRLDHIVQRHARDRAIAEAALTGKTLDELAADHAGRADDQNVHGSLPRWSSRRQR